MGRGGLGRRILAEYALNWVDPDCCLFLVRLLQGKD